MDSNLFGQNWKLAHPDAPLFAFKTHVAVTLHAMLAEFPDAFVVSETDRPKVSHDSSLPGMWCFLCIRLRHTEAMVFPFYFDVLTASETDVYVCISMCQRNIHTHI